MEHSDVNKLAVSATLHCLTGCALGEILGLIIGTILGLSALITVIIAVCLAFLFGYALSLLPVLKAGVSLSAALPIVLASDTLSIATMEIVDNLVMLAVPGAMEGGIVNPVFWITLAFALMVAGLAAYPVNRYLLSKGKGHALIHGAMGHGAHGNSAHGEKH